MGIEIDNFLDDIKSLQEYCLSLDYDGEVNPADGVLYPGINTAVPEHIKKEVKEKLKSVLGDVTINSCFFRLSTKGMNAPHQAHNDAIMGDVSVMIYIRDGAGGTGLVTHRERNLSWGVNTEEEVEIWKKDTNNYYAWATDYIAFMKENRAFVFDANRMHRAEPVGGFGNDKTDGRLVLTFFLKKHIRQARKTDIPKIVELSKTFWGRSSLSEYEFQPEAVELMANHLIDNGIFLVADYDGVVGFVCGMYAPALANRDVLVVSSLAFYVDEAYQKKNIGRCLRDGFEQQAKLAGAAKIAFNSMESSLPKEIMERFFGEAGYKLEELTYGKVL